MDTGAHTSLLEAATYVETIEKRQGLKVACIEEVAYRMGYIDSGQVEKLACPLINNGYGQYLLNMLKYDVRGALRCSTGKDCIHPPEPLCKARMKG
jgi:glucose-1-phosphate thymidylyltransferase